MCSLYITQYILAKPEFDLLIAGSILLNEIGNYCKTIELSFCRTFHVSVFIVHTGVKAVW